MSRISAAGCVVLIAAALGAWLVYGMLRPRPSGAPNPHRRSDVRTTVLKDGAKVDSDSVDIVVSLRAALSRGGAIPTDTKIIRLEVDQTGGCTVELSPEFMGVNEHGSTGESEAMNGMINALEPFDKVRTLTVMVNGKVFEGAHSGDWDRIPIHAE
ncbi:MAG: GerMN domain-containing protein [Chthonomonadales bacterium]|nr:GerMN domain-containing protein [Chthonomonadales bacterium]